MEGRLGGGAEGSDGDGEGGGGVDGRQGTGGVGDLAWWTGCVGLGRVKSRVGSSE